MASSRRVFVTSSSRLRTPEGHPGGAPRKGHPGGALRKAHPGRDVPHGLPLGGIALATFLLGFVAPLVRRLFGSRGALWFAGGGLAGLRLLEQFSTDPALDLYLSLASVALFLIFLSTFIF